VAALELLTLSETIAVEEKIFSVDAETVVVDYFWPVPVRVDEGA